MSDSTPAATTDQPVLITRILEPVEPELIVLPSDPVEDMGLREPTIMRAEVATTDRRRA